MRKILASKAPIAILSSIYSVNGYSFDDPPRPPIPVSQICDLLESGDEVVDPEIINYLNKLKDEGFLLDCSGVLSKDPGDNDGPPVE